MGQRVSVGLSGLILGLLTIMPLSAKTLVAQVEMMGAGADNCGTYLENIRSPESEEYRAAYVAWTLGFISGANWTDAKKQSRPPDVPTISAFMDNFCRRNPLLTVIEGTMALIGETGGREVKFNYQK